MIEIRNLTKRFGDRVAVDDLTFSVASGRVTGFLGPNGAGKSTTMRLVMGLDAADSGTALVNGRRLAEHPAPIAQIGSLLEARSAHPKRSARNHLRAIGATSGVGSRRVDEVLGAVGLEEVSGLPVGSFSLGMGQRLGIASALLGDPETVMLDEPVNGLDPEGIVWIRGLLAGLAAEGRTVFVSSHLMSEMAMIAEHYVVIGRGRLLADVPAERLAAQAETTVLVRSTDQALLAGHLTPKGASITPGEAGAMIVRGMISDEIGLAAASAGIAVLELATRTATLEEVFMDMTRDAVEYHGESLEEVAS